MNWVYAYLVVSGVWFFVCFCMWLACLNDYKARGANSDLKWARYFLISWLTLGLGWVPSVVGFIYFRITETLDGKR